MRLVPSTDAVPLAVNRYLLPHERQVITVLHPASLIGPGLTLSGLVAALARTVTAIPLAKVESLLPRVRYMPYPEQLYLELSSLLYPDAAGEDE
jgi:hypothetical protein